MNNDDEDCDEYKSDIEKLRFNILYHKKVQVITVSFSMSVCTADLYKNAGWSKTYTHELPKTD